MRVEAGTEERRINLLIKDLCVINWLLEAKEEKVEKVTYSRFVFMIG